MLTTEIATQAKPTCLCCGQPYLWRWTDTHGIAVCHHCGLPYRIYHYEGEGEDMKRVDKPPEPALDAAWIAICKRYWEAKHARVLPGVYDMGSLRRFRGETYSGATTADIINWDNWCRRHKRELPQPTEDVTC